MHRLFTRQNADLYITLQISLADSLCGFKRTVTTIDEKMITIERVGPTEPESECTYSSLGMPDLKNPEQRGDLVVKFRVRYPGTLTERQQVQIRQTLQESMQLKRSTLYTTKGSTGYVV